ncbi:MAG: 2Fe-2S iron-sulfur cluster binding domain-containing protein, partial [Proteobacteria bacterium]|nr:2Fe-2S iron-sulfur cluster binding domain-containing protein [Pseudomonadota bacterium]
MARANRISLNGAAFEAKSGARLLDAALASGIDLPHDCRAGRCGSCLTRVKSGVTLGGEALERGMIYACQAMIFSDLELEIEPTPPVTRCLSRIVEITEIARDTVEIVLELFQPFEILPGQYCRFRFRGYPPRSFSPTAPLAPARGDSFLRLQVKRVRDGRVTPALGREIKVGHPVQIDGPFGHAFLRPAGSGRLILIGS